MSKRLDLVGKRFGSVVVIKDDGERSADGSMKWLCKCDCGKICSVNTYYLRHSANPSCGCYQKMRTSITHKKYNKYDLSGEYGIGYDSNGAEFYFDLEDYNKIKDVCWLVGEDNRVSGRKNGRMIRLHKLITGTGENVIIDHINHNARDNRKSNLRVSNKQTNGINRPCNKNNKLGVKGVCVTKSGKYFARIAINGKEMYLGSYETIEEAKQARYEAEIKYFGEFAYNDGESG